VFLETTCAACHTIRGTDADGELGPDLTHFARRLTIGAGAVENNRGNLGGWVVDPQTIKPGRRGRPRAVAEAVRLTRA
jgi:cytochrome c oxidase subunit 2